jgi:hypothetical protein
MDTSRLLTGEIARSNQVLQVDEMEDPPGLIADRFRVICCANFEHDRRVHLTPYLCQVEFTD